MTRIVNQNGARAAPISINFKEKKNEKTPKTTPKQRRVLFAINNRRMYGLEIQAAIEQSSKGREKIRTGALYPLLHFLEQQKLVQSEWGDETVCGARRRYYSLTDLGHTVVAETIEYYDALLQGKYTE